jgi:ketosteroid isomerase-like protein
MGEQRLEFNWLESAVLKKEKGEWKIAFYHSTEKPKPKPDPEKEQAAIEKCLDNISKAYARKDIELLSKVTASGEGLCIFGTDEAEKWTDRASYLESQRRWFKNVEESRFIIKERSIHPDPTATYARFYQIADFEGISEGKPFKVKNTRMSGILEKQNGRWVMVQWHGSVPVSGQMVKY